MEFWDYRKYGEYRKYTENREYISNMGEIRTNFEFIEIENGGRRKEFYKNI